MNMDCKVKTNEVITSWRSGHESVPVEGYTVYVSTVMCILIDTEALRYEGMKGTWWGATVDTYTILVMAVTISTLVCESFWVGNIVHL